MKTTNFLRLRISFFGFLVVSAVLFSQQVFALSFNLADHPGMCFQHVDLSGHIATILLYPCANPSTYTLNDNTLTSIIIKSVCTYTYNCGACVSGYKNCSVASVVPTGYTCDNQPVTQQTCTVPSACTSYDYNAWGACVSGVQTHTIKNQYPTGCTDTASAALSQTCAMACTSYDYNAWGACVSGVQTLPLRTNIPQAVPTQPARHYPRLVPWLAHPMTTMPGAPAFPESRPIPLRTNIPQAVPTQPARHYPRLVPWLAHPMTTMPGAPAFPESRPIPLRTNIPRAVPM